jgi:P-type Ca2+ transporter type 2C
MSSQPIYTLRPAEVYSALTSSPAGLTADQIEELRDLYGRNVLVDAPVPDRGRKLVRLVTHPMALLLWAAGLISFVIGHPAQGGLIWTVVLINAGFSLWRDHQAEQAVNALSGLLPAYARVIRDGKELQIPTDDLVPGDLLVLAEGDNIPADARVVEEYGLRTNNATLSGEAMPARKVADASLRSDLTELERPNLIFAGTTVVSGTGRAVVYTTGMLTQFGRITHLTQTVREEPGQLQRNMEKLSRKVTIVALVIGAVVLLESVVDLGMPVIEAVLLAVGIIVAVIPEGLTPTVTLVLAAAVQRLAQRGVLVKKLAKVETLGTVSVVCTDKSGTLTQNQMTVREIWVGGERVSVSGGGYEPTGAFASADRVTLHPEKPRTSREKDLQALLRGGLLCSNARLRPPTREQPQWSALGDHTEAALKVAALKGGLEEEAENQRLPRVHELPFDARRKRMSTIHRSPDGEKVFVKGAPREILQLCKTYSLNGETCPLTERVRSEILSANDSYARSGLRVLGIASRSLPPRTGAYEMEQVERELVFLGLLGMMDPPRPEVAAATQSLRKAGIRMIMITGDYGLTAESIARRVGMLSSPNPRIITGAEFEQMSDDDLRLALREETIFARMAPENKLCVVDFLQREGEVVAVIGDGVNDAPALRKADVGIAMGQNGTDVAREAADLILIEDSIGEVPTAIMEGRAVFDNLRKVLTYLFASNVPEVMPFILMALFHIPLALTVIQILAIDLGTDLFPALALGMEKPEADIMLRPPRRRAEPLVDRRLLLRAYGWLGLIETGLCFTGFFWVYDKLTPLMRGLGISSVGTLLGMGTGVDAAYKGYLPGSTIFLAGVVIVQIGNVFACRTEKGHVHRLGWLSNPFILGAVGFDVLFLLTMVYFSPVAKVFNLVPLSPQAWILLSLFAPVLLVLEKIRKEISLHLGQVRSRKQEGAVV